MDRKRKRVVVPLEKKVEALRRIDSGESLRSISLDFGVGESTVGDWKKNRKEIEERSIQIVSRELSPNQKTLKRAANEDMEEALFMWFSHERERGMPISGPILQAKALQFFKETNNNSSKFTASKGWLDKFKRRFGIHQLSIQGEKLSADNPAAQRYKETFRQCIEDKCLVPAQVYNADETGLYYKLLPSKTLVSKLEKEAAGYKKSKERVTILACANASGDHKLPLLVVGKSKNPRAFKNVNRNALPCKYVNSKTAWMTSVIFQEWFLADFVPAVTEFLKSKNLPPRAALLIDNAPSHPTNVKLCSGEIEVIFLPPNVTSILQPLDQGVLETFKRNYKQSLMLHILPQHNLISGLKSINIKEVMYMCANAWDKILRNTIIKSWFNLWKCQIPIPDEQSDETNLTEILELVRNVEGCEDVNERDMEEWLSEKDKEINDADIVAAIEQDSEDEDEIPQKKISHEEGASSLNSALQYMEQCNDTSPEVLLM